MFEILQNYFFTDIKIFLLQFKLNNTLKKNLNSKTSQQTLA